MNATASTNSAEPTIHNRKSPRRQFIVQPILDPASHDLADSTHYDEDKATPTPPIIAMLPLEEEQDTNTNQEQAIRRLHHSHRRRSATLMPARRGLGRRQD